MALTYQDIRAKREQNEERRDRLINTVIKEAHELLIEYVESLELGSATWADINGVNREYVEAGVMFGGEFKRYPLNSITLDDKYGARFAIATVIDDTPRGGEIIPIGVYLYIRDGNVIVNIDNSNRPITVIQGENKYKNVCEEIKTQTLVAMNDPGLN
ncbi:hypothetical protein [Pectobacterium odoriferum]|uniref:hypothetical protein n=1 Tax=Pectobacterium odoriferum TaxID=78398 RepID=UPI000CD323F6|nr:hypothetical protein [Pectobacterium odoriferum]POE20491.1 hypothetical protein BV918_02125 [Pectobacterium odoriferum]POE37211.1 hypothetical protein BV922_02120 [Pectobacterium odoriferum]